MDDTFLSALSAGVRPDAATGESQDARGQIGLRRGGLLMAASAGALAAAGWAGAAQAQDGEEVLLGPVQVEGEGEAYRAEELDSPKRPVPLVDTPNSITVITEDVLDDTGATSLVDALRTVPGITMAMGEGGQPFSDRPFLRGYESTSGLLVDGLRDTGSQNRDVFNLESVEVAKGPGGAYAGRGGPGGTVNLVTKAPRDRNFVSGMARVGDPSYARGVLDANHVLSDMVAVRGVVLWQDSDVPGRDAVFDDRWGFAPSITVGLNSPTQVTASYYHYETDSLADYGHPLEPNTGQAKRGPLQGLDRDNYYGLANRDHSKSEVDSFTGEISRRFEGGWQVRNILRYADTLNDYIATNPDDSQGNVPNGLVFRNVKSRYEQNESWVNQTDLTGTFATGSLFHNLALGMEFSNEQTDATSYSVETNTAPGGGTIGRGECDLFGAGADSNYNCTDLYAPNPDDPWAGAISLNSPGTLTDVDTFALYLFDTVELSDRWLVNLGARYDDYKSTVEGVSRGTPYQARNESDFLSYQAGLTFKPVPEGSVYASFGSSSSPSGVTAGAGGENLSVGNEDLKPEKSYNYEAGVKWELFEGRLLATAALFQTERQDGHVSAGRGQPSEAIGKSRVRGLELSATGQITDRWSLFAGYSYQDSEIVADADGSDVGNRLPNAPVHSLSFWTTFQVTSALTVGGGARYQDERFGNTANTTYVPDYWVMDAFADYQVTDRFGLQLNVNNLTDETYYDRVYTTHMATLGPARQILLTGNFDF